MPLLDTTLLTNALGEARAIRSSALLQLFQLVRRRLRLLAKLAEPRELFGQAWNQGVRFVKREISGHRFSLLYRHGLGVAWNYRASTEVNALCHTGVGVGSDLS